MPVAPLPPTHCRCAFHHSLSPLPLIISSHHCTFPHFLRSSYSDPAVAAFLRDVLDGYFPLQFKDSHPDGVGFDVTDHSSSEYGGQFKAFSGAGHVAGSSDVSVAFVTHSMQMHECCFYCVYRVPCAVWAHVLVSVCPVEC